MLVCDPVRATLIALIALGVAVVGLAAAQTAANVALAGTGWNAIELYGTSIPPRPADVRPHLLFGADGRVSGSDGCNRLTGGYSVKQDGISFGPSISTRMACPAEDDVARQFQTAMKDAAQWRITNEHLEFYGATGKPLATFERRVTTP